MERKILTLCILCKDSKVLLGLKKRGFGAGKWNGFGGKLESGESIADAARREVFEESGLRVNNLEKIGEIDFEFIGDPVVLAVNIFKCIDFEGEPAETEEMRPQWFNNDEIPFDSMWLDDRHWFPLALSDKKFNGKFVFEGNDKIISHQLNVVSAI